MLARRALSRSLPKINNLFRNFARIENISPNQLSTLQKVLGIMKKTMPVMNDEIEFVGEIRLIGDDETPGLGLINIELAKEKSKELDMDLVLLNDKIKPALCRIEDFRQTTYYSFYKTYLKDSISNSEITSNRTYCICKES